jgi:hypothetical protein
LCLETISEAGVARAEDGHESRRGLVLESLLPFARVFMGLGLVEGNVGFVDLVVEVMLEDAAGACGIPFLGDEPELFEDGFLVCLAAG